MVVVAAATLAGGALPLRFEQHSRLFLGFSAGTLVGLSLLELIPDGLETLGGEPHRWLLITLGAFLATMLLDRLHVLHPHEHGLDASCPATEHAHRPLAMHGAWGLVVHSAFDGIALATALRGSVAAALAVALALSAHKFADGLTTVALVLSHHHRKAQAVRLLGFNAAALVVGILVGLSLPLGRAALAVLLLAIAGFFLYLGASDLIPALTGPTCRKRDVLATAAGMALVAIVATLAH